MLYEIWSSILAKPMHVLLTKHMGNIVRLTAAPFGHVSSTVLLACLVNNTFTTCTARLPTLSPFCFVFVALRVKIRSILCYIGLAEQLISRNMDRSRISGLASCMTTVTCRVINSHKTIYLTPLKKPSEFCLKPSTYCLRIPGVH